MDDPVSALLGAVFIAMGLLLSYGAFRNKKVFGKNGMLPTAITTGKILDIDKIPDAFPSFKLPGSPDSKVPSVPLPLPFAAIDKVLREFWERVVPNAKMSDWAPPSEVVQALSSMTAAQPYYGARLSIEVSKLRNYKDGDSLQLTQILIDGFRTRWNKAEEADTVADYVEEVTGVSV